mgnify:CR=1 FL=1
MATEFKLPELGENIEEAQVVTVSVAKGDAVQKDQAVVEVETDKAVMEVPIDGAGTVQQVMVSEGDTLKVGQTILTYDGEAAGGGDQPPADEAKAEPATDARAEQAPRAETQPAEAHAAEAQPAASQAPAEAPPSDNGGESTDQPPPDPDAVKETRSSEPAPVQPKDSEQRLPVFAAPSVRRFAREVGVDIAQVAGSGPGGRISVDDVKRHARHVGGNGQVGQGAPARSALPPLPDFSREGPVERQAMSMIAKKTAQHMANCWAAIPHVTLNEHVDVTDLESFRRAHKSQVEREGGKLTVTAILLKLVVSALKQYPTLNCSYDSRAQEIIHKRYYHVGVAADTPRGLLVPVLRDADRKSLTQISVELTELAKQARDGKLALEQMQGGTFTITNLGGIGCGTFTPIVNHPEVAILGVGTARPQLIQTDDGRTDTRAMMPLSLSFDHRVVNGADGARFLTWVKNAIEHPLGALLS